MDDDIEMELWFEMTEAEQDAELAAAERRHNELWATLSLDQQYSILRTGAVRGCLQWRWMIREHGFDFMRQYLKERQVSMVKLRHWRRTGIYPGEA